MTLDLDVMFQDMRRGAGMADIPASRRSFMRALIGTLGEVNPRWGTEYEVPDEDDPNGTITIEASQYNAIWHGVRFYLQQQGAWASETDGEAFNKFDLHTRRAISAAIVADDPQTRNQMPDDD